MLVEAKGEAGFVKDYLKHKIEESYGSLKRKAAKAIQAALKDHQNRGLCLLICKTPNYMEKKKKEFKRLIFVFEMIQCQV